MPIINVKIIENFFPEEQKAGFGQRTHRCLLPGYTWKQPGLTSTW